ncbi:MAG: DUF4097 family beta strand repeat-containing protein [Halobacteriales archaeon]|nr:DUF4097 family beta strand repeat-containing protein [Halobacteriales archaeon]
MQRAHALVLLSAAILAVPAGFAAVSVGDHLLAQSSQPVAKSTAGDVAQSWEGTIGSEVTQGILDLRTFRGNIHVQGVDGDAWSVQVLLPPRDPNAMAVPGEPTLAYDFRGDVDEDGALALLLQVTRDGSALVSMNSQQVPDIVATVPARLLWESVHLCSAVDHQTDDLGLGSLFGGKDEPKEQGCVKDQGQGLDLALNSDPTVQAQDRVPFLVEGLHGDQLSMVTNDADMGAKAVRFAEADLVANNGNLVLAGAFEDLQAVSNNGAIKAELTNSAAAKAQLLTNNGNVVVTVPVAKDRGYAVHAMTNNGAIRIELPDMEGAPEKDDQQAPGTSFGLPLLAAKPPAPPPQQHSPNHAVSAHSKDFDAARVPTTLELITNNGNVVVAPIKAEAR